MGNFYTVGSIMNATPQVSIVRKICASCQQFQSRKTGWAVNPRSSRIMSNYLGYTINLCTRCANEIAEHFNLDNAVRELASKDADIEKENIYDMFAPVQHNNNNNNVLIEDVTTIEEPLGDPNVHNRELTKQYWEYLRKSDHETLGSIMTLINNKQFHEACVKFYDQMVIRVKNENVINPVNMKLVQPDENVIKEIIEFNANMLKAPPKQLTITN